MTSGIPPGARVDLVEDQEFTRGVTVERLRAAAAPGARVRGFASVEDLVEAGDVADLVVLDLALAGGGLQGVEAIRELTRGGHRVLVFAGGHSAEALEQAQAAGARGFVSKDLGGPEDLIRGIAAVLAGEVHVDPKMMERIGAAARKRLSPQQQRVLRLEALGRTTRQIARELDLSEPGVRRHIERIMLVYPQCGKQTERVRLALRLGLVTPFEVYIRPDPQAPR